MLLSKPTTNGNAIGSAIAADRPTAVIPQPATSPPETIWNGDGTDGPVLICPPPDDQPEPDPSVPYQPTDETNGEDNRPETAPEPVAADPQPTETDKTKADFAAELRGAVVAVELQKSNVGKRRRLSRRHSDEIADKFAASRKSVSSTKSLYPPDQPQIQGITSVLSVARRSWLELTIAFRRGVRLLKRERLDDFVGKMEALQPILEAALADADEHADEIHAQCAEWLGSELYDENDYPATFAGSVSVRWSVFNFEPSDDLLRLAPETYRREQKRIAQQFESTLAAYEDECREQLAGLIDALQRKLNPADGEKVKYTESAVTNLREFFARFKTMGIVSDASMGELIADAESAIGGVTTMATLKKSPEQRKTVSAGFVAIKSKLDALIVAAPVRSIDLDDLD